MCKMSISVRYAKCETTINLVDMANVVILKLWFRCF